MFVKKKIALYCICDIVSVSSLAVSTLDSPAVDPRSNPGSDKF